LRDARLTLADLSARAPTGAARRLAPAGGLRLTQDVARGEKAGRGPARTIGALAAAALVVAACSSGTSRSRSGGEIFGHPSSGVARGSADRATTATAATPVPVVLEAPAGTDAATLQATADAVRARLARMQVPVSSVTATPDGVAVVSQADPYQLEAAARQEATTIAPVTSSALGPCHGARLDSVGPAARCYTVGAPLVGVTPVTGAVPATASGAGWKVTMSIAPAQYQSLRAPLDNAAGQAQTLALLGGDDVVLAFSAGVPGLASQVGPALTEEQARRTAAALAVDNDLPVALSAPAVPPPQGARQPRLLDDGARREHLRHLAGQRAGRRPGHGRALPR
jgi:hypothetical protein